MAIPASLADVTKARLIDAALDASSTVLFPELIQKEARWAASVNTNINTICTDLPRRMVAAANNRAFSVKILIIEKLDRFSNLCADSQLRDINTASFESYLLGNTIPNIIYSKGLNSADFTITQLNNQPAVPFAPEGTFYRAYEITWGPALS